MPQGSFTSEMQVLVVLVVGRDSLAWGGEGGLQGSVRRSRVRRLWHMPCGP